MASESAAAKAGGVFTVCDMPNTNPPTTSVEAFKDKVERASKIKDVDIRFFFGITASEHVEEFKKVINDDELRKKCPGAKVFFDHSTGDMGTGKEVLEEAFKTCAELGVPLVAHCEDAEINNKSEVANAECREVSLHSVIRPVESEVKAIEDAIGFAKTYGTHLHVAHLSTGGGLELVKKAKESGVKVTCEVAPHHLFLTEDNYHSLGTLAKMNPPVRSKADQEALWSGISDRIIDCISTDHAPHTLNEKREGFPLQAPSGVPGVETMLPLLFTVASGVTIENEHGPSDLSTINFKYEDIIRLCFENPNKIFNLGASDEPRIKIDPSVKWVIRAKNLHYKCGWTPYENWEVLGKITNI